MSQKWNRVFLGCLVIVLALVSLAGCKKSDDDKKSDDAVSTVRLQMSWTHNNEYAPMYIADDKGYYASENVKTELTPLLDAEGNAADVIDEVVSGRAQFGVIDAGAIMVARSQGKPLVAVMALYQRHPLALVSLKDNNIIRPQDLVGKTVHLTPQTMTIFDALLASQGIARDSVTIVERTDYTIAPLTSGEADVIDAWVTNEVVAMTEQNIEYNAIFAYEYGVDMYPDLVFTTEDYIKNNSKVVQGFVNATVKGINDTIAEREKAAELTVARDPSLSLDVELAAIGQGVPLLVPAGSKAGMMTAENWAVAYNILIEEGVLTTPIDFNAAYDMTFLNKVYGE